jgi:hypothetical protein
MPLQRVVERNALADEAFAMVNEQPQIELGALQLRRWQGIQAGEPSPPRRIELPFRDAWVAPLPDATVVGFRAGKSTTEFRLPPATQQCGYQIARSF